MKTYTFEIFKLDRRMKEGKKLVTTMDFEIEEQFLDSLINIMCVKFPGSKGYSFNLQDTYVTRRSAMDGTEFTERYDTPYFCSPSSETFWSM